MKFFHSFINYLPFIIMLYIIGIIFGFVFYYFVMRKRFLLRLFFESFPQKINIESKTQTFSEQLKYLKPTKKFDSVAGPDLVIKYKNIELIKFANLIDYSNFCYFFKSYLNMHIETRQWVDVENFLVFLKAVDVESNEFGDYFFPGYYDKDSKIYEDYYFLSAYTYSKFLYNYNKNKSLRFSTLLLERALNVRDDAKLVEDNDQNGLKILDIYSSAFIRDKFDILQLWYVIINLKELIEKDKILSKSILLYGESFSQTKPSFIIFKSYFTEFKKKLTEVILADFRGDLWFFEKIYLYIFFKNNNDFDHLKKYINIFFQMPIMFRRFIYLLPPTLLLYLIYNTAYSVVSAKVLTAYVVLFTIRAGFTFVKKLIHYDYSIYNSKYGKTNIIIRLALQRFARIVFSLITLSLALTLTTLLDENIQTITTHNFNYLCLYLSLCLALLIDLLFNVTRKIENIIK